MLACNMSHITGEQLALALFFIVAWWVSGAMALVNPVMIRSLRASPKFKLMNFGIWASYAVPGAILLFGLYDKIQVNIIPSIIWQVYVVTIPFITVSHFAFLFWKRRRIRLINAETKRQE